MCTYNVGVALRGHPSLDLQQPDYYDAPKFSNERNLTMPHFDDSPYPCRYNSLRLLGYDYTSTHRLCAITLVTELRRPVFADMKLAKSILGSLLSDEIRKQMYARAFTLMPDHLHLLAGVRQPKSDLRSVIGQFKSFTAQLYWKRSREIVTTEQLSLPSTSVNKSDIKETKPLLRALADWNATLRPEIVQLTNWPSPEPQLFLTKHLWQPGFFDHVIRNEKDLQQNLAYIALNPVRAGYVTQPYFYPFTGFICEEFAAQISCT
jgi:REP element-mobilizing transposase RayT